MPRPMVLATAVPRKKAARKLKTAAQTTASLGESTRVEAVQEVEDQSHHDGDDYEQQIYIHRNGLLDGMDSSESRRSSARSLPARWRHPRLCRSRTRAPHRAPSF